MSTVVTLNIVVTDEIKQTLQRWAAQDERSVSYIVRQLVLAEKSRREEQEVSREEKTQNHEII